ncbi:MAG TPA: hypothetical protein VK020_07745 [Microlunatus sp.]|nr:hypothetical protein [Microlunatus sp.]
MIPVAVVLIVLVIVFTIAIIIGNPQAFELQIFVARIPANITGVYVTGAVTMLVLAVAGWLLWSGLVRFRAQQKEIRALKAAAGVGGKQVGTGSKGTGSKGTAAGDTTAKGIGTKETAAPDTVARDTAASDAAARGTGVGGTGAGSKNSGVEPAAGEKRPAPKSGSTGSTGAPRTGPAADAETTPEERRRLLDEADELTRDDDSRS